MTPTDPFDEKAHAIANNILSSFSWTSRREGDPMTFVVAAIAQALREAVEAEREACIRVVEHDPDVEKSLSFAKHTGEVLFRASQRIRARGGAGRGDGA
jgi:hypothetical protein